MKIARKDLVKIISESVIKEILDTARQDWYDDGDMSYSEVAEKCWAGEIKQIYSIHDPVEDIRHIGNVYGKTPVDCYGRLFKGVETGTIYFLEM